jgi:hypothetical protein
MQSSAPDLDFETCIELGRFMAKKLRMYEDIISKNPNSFFLNHFIEKREYYRKEMIIYAKLANYMKYLEEIKK